MADSATTSNRFRKQSLGSNLNVWGDPYLNTNFDLIDESLDGQTTVTLTSGTTTLTSTNYATDESRQRVLVLAGTLSGNCTIIIPAVEKWYLVPNGATMGAFTITIKTSGGVGASIPSGGSYIVMCDGTDTAIRRTLDFGSNEIKNVGSATASTSAPTYAQVITAAETRSMGGFRLTSVGTGTASADAVNLNQMTLAIAAAGVPAASGAVLVSLTDTTPNYLGAKVIGTGAIAVTTDSAGGNERLRLNVPTFAGVATTTSTAAAGVLPAIGTGPLDRLLMVGGTYSAKGPISQGTHAIMVQVRGMTPETTAGPIDGVSESTTNKVMDDGLDFNGTSVTGAQTAFPVPASYDGLPFSAMVYARAMGTGTGAAVFQVSAQFQRPGSDPFDGAWGTAILGTIATSTATYKSTGTLASITPAGTYAANALLRIRLQRVGTSAGDTLASDARAQAMPMFFNYNAQTDA
jgi:hypothetical protein